MGPAGLRALLDDHADRRGRLAGGAGGAGSPPPPSAVPGSAAPVERLVAAWAADRGRVRPGRVLAAPRRRRHRRGAPRRRGLSRPRSSTIPSRPPILFHRGDPDVVVGTRVAIVGTRDCTRYGHDLAFELARDLSAGRRLGRVGPGPRHRRRRPRRRARRRRLAPPIAVVGSGLDVVYPRRNGAAVARGRAHGAWCWSEYPLGHRGRGVALPGPQPPDRRAGRRRRRRRVPRHGRRAAHRRRGAERRAGRCMAVPGPVHSPSSAGTQRPAGRRPGDGRGPRRHRRARGPRACEPGSQRPSTERRPPPPAPTTGRCSTPSGGSRPPSTTWCCAPGCRSPSWPSALVRLEHDGWVAPRGGWYERVAKPGG